MTAGDDFFDGMTKQSRVKTNIVSDYFSAWANVILKTVERFDGKLGYIDLFSGPGIYDDGTKSTPIIILEEAIKNHRLCERLVTLFNDTNPEFIKLLKGSINKISGIDRLKNTPIILNDTVGDKLVRFFSEISLIPSMFFIDPWGYKGLSLSLLKSILKDWGCDCIFFFNYNRINAGLNNPLFDDHINAIFGEKRAAKLREGLIRSTPQERELKIIEELGLAINDLGFKYTLPFCFKDDSGKKTSHYLIFISKNEKGYNIMKNIMAKYSSESYQGVPSFEYCPVKIQQPFLFPLKTPLDDLLKMLLNDFRGKKVSMLHIFKSHNIGKPFIRRNYMEVLIKMELEGLIKAKPSINERPRGTFADKVMVTFSG